MTPTRRAMLRLATTTALACAAYAQGPSNDDPAGAVALSLGENPAGGGYFDNFGATTSSGVPAAACGSFPEGDVWFQYLPVRTGPHVFSLCNPAGRAPGSLVDSVLAVYDVGLSSALACDDDTCAAPSPAGASLLSHAVLNLTTGAPVYVRVSSWQGAAQGSFRLTVLDDAAPGGTNCASAPSAGDGVHYVNLFGDVPSGFTGGGSCPNFAAGTPDAYFVYVAPSAGICFVSYDGAGVGRAAVYTVAAPGVCSAPVLVAGTCVTTRHFSFATAAGATYLLRFGLAAAPATSAAGGQVVAIRTLPNAPPGNDACAGALTLFPKDNPTSTVGATPDPAFAAACPSGSFADATTQEVWGAFTTSAPGRTTFGCAGFGSQQVAVYAGSCSPAGIVACGSPATVVDAVGGTTFYVRAGPTSASGRTAANLWARERPFPSNDECAGATQLALGGNPGLSNWGATTSADPQPPCSPVVDDVWYAWTAPYDGAVRIALCGATNDPVLAVYAGCGGALAACDDDDAGNAGPCAATAPLVPYVRLVVAAGTAFRLRIGVATAAETNFAISIAYEFGVSFNYSAATSTATFAVVGGPPGALVFNALSANAGAFPAGWFFGVDLTPYEFAVEAFFGPPFLVFLDPTGTYLLPATGYVPFGIAAYAVTATIVPPGLFGATTPPVTFVL
jgi:hypothetical protein